MPLPQYSLVFLAATLSSVWVTGLDICTSNTTTFTAVVDLSAGELGYFTFKECPGLVSPTIGIELGVTYTFLQEDRSNWYHPIGFAYEPDGALANKDELEPIISQTGSDCVEENSCPSPKYMLDGVFLGVTETEDFGLDVYEPGFFASPAEWTSAGVYSITLTFDDENYSKDIFYFCHIHQYMSGRIKILKDGVPVSEVDEPALGYEYDTPGEFDKSCGTHGLDAFQLPNAQCPDKFVCIDTETTDSTLKAYSTCTDAMNCAMMAGMTTGVKAGSPQALFIHQMIPHHQNAVNMAKSLLKLTAGNCDDLANEDDPDCFLEAITRDMVNVQNHQIQTMRAYLKAKNFPPADDCVVEITKASLVDSGNTNGATIVGAVKTSAAFERGLAMTIALAVAIALI